MKACIKFRTVEMNHYFNIINIDRYDVIIGTVFMKQHRIMLDFKKDQVRMRGEKPLSTMQKCRQLPASAQANNAT